MKVCESCLTHAYDETGAEDEEMQVLYCLELGHESGDHECERDKDTPCACSCRGGCI